LESGYRNPEKTTRGNTESETQKEKEDVASADLERRKR
jgi:hypothetical protein